MNLTRKDIANLFGLLKIYFPRSPKADDKTLQTAWLLLLEPYSPEAVKKAIVGQLQQSTYWPDAQEIAVRCNALDSHEIPPLGRVDRGISPEMAKYVRGTMQLHSELFADEYHACGVNTWEEAKAAGICWESWRKSVKAERQRIEGMTCAEMYR